MGSHNRRNQISEQHLVVSSGPSADLPSSHLPALRRFLIAFGRIGIYHLPAAGKQAIGKLRVLRKHLGIEPAGLQKKILPEASHRSPVLRNGPEVIAGLLIDLISSGPLQVNQSCQHLLVGVVRNHPAHNRTDLRILKGDGNLLQHVPGRTVIRIKNNDDFPFGQLHRIVQADRLSPLSAVPVQRTDEFVFSVILLQHFLRFVGRIVINRNDFKPVPVVIALQKRVQNIGQHLFLIVHGNQHRNVFHSAGQDIVVIQVLLPQESHKREVEMSRRVQQHQNNHKNDVALHDRYNHFHASFPFRES
ncbi:unknown [Firmicutes bacterium CAG:791]|nr:unknown [Firmicutes bacterium CAG:791]